MTMNWDAIGALGELLGATVVFITLVYLAMQVKSAKLTAIDANRLARAKGVTDMQLSYLADQRWDSRANIYKANGVYSYYETLAADMGISVEEANRADIENIYWFWLHWGQFSSQNSPEDLKELAHTIGMFYQLPIMQYSWNNSPWAQPLLGDKFIEFVEQSVKAASSNSE
jgi:hypothetical protein